MIQDHIVTQKSPAFSQKRPIFSQKSHIVTQKSHAFSQKSPIFSLKGPIFSPKSPRSDDPRSDPPLKIMRYCFYYSTWLSRSCSLDHIDQTERCVPIRYAVAMTRRLLKIIGLFCKRTL